VTRDATPNGKTDHVHDLSKVSHRLKVACSLLVAVRDDDLRAALG
jgi:hypothetical protein